MNTPYQIRLNPHTILRLGEQASVNFNLHQLCQRAGLSYNVVWEAMNGKRTPHLSTVYKILRDGLGLDPNAIADLSFFDLFLVTDER